MASFSRRSVWLALAPTLSKVMPLWVFSGKSCVSSTSAEESACPYSAEYAPVLKSVPLNSKGENRPRCGTSGVPAK